MLRRSLRVPPLPSRITCPAPVPSSVHRTELREDRVAGMHLRSIRGGLLLLVVGLWVPSFAGATERKIYWTDITTRKIQRANPDGTQIEDVHTPASDFPGGPGIPHALAFDPVAEKLYWLQNGGGSGIWRADLDGSNAEQVIPAGGAKEDVDLDPIGRWLYWTQVGPSHEVLRAGIDGLDTEVIWNTDDPDEYPNLRGIVVDPDEGKVYWSDRGIRRSNLDGSELVPLIPNVVAQSIALDPRTRTLYWVEPGASERVRRASLDDLQVEELVTESLEEPSGISLDLQDGKIYWNDQYLGKIQRANLDGSLVEDVVLDLANPSDVLFVPEPPSPLSRGIALSVTAVVVAAMARERGSGISLGTSPADGSVRNVPES